MRGSQAKYHCDWITVGDHRFRVSQRNGPPGSTVRRCGMIAAWVLEDFGNPSPSDRLVDVFHENRKGYAVKVTIGTTDYEVDSCSGAIKAAIEAVFDGIEVSVNRVEVKPGNVNSDKYDLTDHMVHAAFKSLGWEADLD